MEQYQGSIIVVLLFTLAIFVYAQSKFKNKMLCYFLRPNKQRIKKFVPIYSNYVVFDRGRYGIGRYNVDPNCIVHEWYTQGVNKFFPVLIPTLDFEWWSPNPRDPSTGQITWRTPEVEAAAYNGQSYVGMARAMAQQSGTKRNKIAELLPLVILGVLIIGGFLIYQYLGSLNEQLGALQQMINLKK